MNYALRYQRENMSRVGSAGNLEKQLVSALTDWRKLSNGFGLFVFEVLSQLKCLNKSLL